MKKIHLFLSLYLPLFLSLSCSQSDPEENRNYIEWEKLEKRDWKDIPDGLLSEKEYILLETENEESLIAYPKKIDYINGEYLIHDGQHQMNKLVIYNPVTKEWRKIGRVGQGPFEFLNLGSFDIDREGNIYLADSHFRSKTIFKYDNKGEGITTLPMLVDAGALKSLPSGGFMFWVYSWNTGPYAGDQIVTTDHDFNITSSGLKYDEFIDESMSLGDVFLIESDHTIFYSRTIDNHIYTFSMDGELKTIYEIDFGKQNVPDEHKKDLEGYWDEFDRYCLLRDFTILTDELIIGKVYDRKKVRMFLIDRINNRCYLTDPSKEYIRYFLLGFRDRRMFSYMDEYVYDNLTDEEKSELPQDVISHLEEDKAVLCIQKLLR